MTIVSFGNEQDVLSQGFKFRPHWWADRVKEPGWATFVEQLPALNGDYKWINRADLLASAKNGWPSALLACYVWGTGGSGFLVGRRARVFRDNSASRIADALASSVEILKLSGSVLAYQSLLGGGSNKLKHLGPSFFTKFLYVADAKDAQPGRALILDRFVAIALNDLHGWEISEEGPWAPDTYEQWIALAHSTASDREEPLRPDAVELAYCKHGRFLWARRKTARS